MSEVPSIFEFSGNIADAEAPELLPARSYPAEITGASIKMSQSGNPYLSVQFRVAPEDYPADYPADEEPNGVILSYNRVTLINNKRSLHRLRRFYEALGMSPPKQSTFTQEDLDQFVGQRAEVTVVHGEYNEEPQAQLVGVTAIS